MIRFTLIISLALLAACGGSSTGPDTEPEESNQTEEPTVTTGTLEVSVATAGSGTDEDGYTVTIDGSGSQSLEVNDTVTFSELEEGSYSSELSGLAQNCSVSGDNPLSVNITADETNSVQFDVNCESVSLNAEGTIIFTRRVDQENRIFKMNADGTGDQQLGNGINGSDPAVSPDGQKIAFVKRDQTSGTLDREIWVMDVDGSNQVQLTSNSVDDKRPAWSPDGSQLVYESADANSMSIYVMAPDGSNQRSITDSNGNDHSASWASTNTIAFISNRQGDSSADVYKVQPDGTGLVMLIEASSENGINLFSPDWSPDGTQIAYQGYLSGGAAGIFTADADGKNAQSITSSDFSAMQPSWSPDGNFIAFTNLATAGTTDAIWIVTKDGSQTQKLTDDQETYSNFPSWGL